MTYTVVSFSGGKDSTAMLLRMIELGEHIDEVITCDTGMEFPAMYDHIEKISEIVKDNGIKYTTIRNDKSFEYLMLDQPFNTEKHGEHYGYGWPTPVIRWCTKHLKTKIIDDYYKQLETDHDVLYCIGLAADEKKRLERESNQKKNHRHPLVEWGWTEADCLRYCYDHGYDWDGLYRIFNRVSCWCCPLQPISELRKLWTYYPELWQQLQTWEDTMATKGWTTRPEFKRDWPVSRLTERFEKEAHSKKCQSHIDEFITIQT